METLSVENKLEESRILSLNQFEKQLSEYKAHVSNIEEIDDFANFIFKNFSSLTNFFIAVADQALEQVEPESEPQEISDLYLLNYKIPEELKKLSILHRDILLQHQKTKVLLSEEKLVLSQAEEHFKNTKLVLVSALEEFIYEISNQKQELSLDTKVKAEVEKELLFYNNPWLIYKDQIVNLLQQFITIENSKQSLVNLIEKFNNLKQLVISIDKEHHNLILNVAESIAHIHGDLKDDQPNKSLTSYLDSQVLKINSLGNDQLSITSELTNQINLFDKITIPLESHNGFLNLREVNIKKAIQKWFDYKLTPSFIDLLALEKNLKSSYQIHVANLKSGLELSKSMDTNEFKETLVHSLVEYEEEIQKVKINSKKVASIFENTVRQELLVTNLFSNSSFLEVDFNASMHLNRSTILNKFNVWFEKVYAKFNKEYKKSLYKESFSNIELSINCIAHRMFKEENEHYDTLFLNKNFIGDLFLVPREQQEKKILEAITQWQRGFNKAVLVIGQRLSGRSTFLTYVSRKYFGKDIVILNPNSIAIIDGRKFKTSYDLSAALAFIKNNNIKSTRPVVIIDDIELWRNDDFSLLNNMRALVEFVESESDDTFVIASTTNAMKGHLDRRLQLSDSFSSLIDLSTAYKDEIIEALLLRHGAAHRKLISVNDEVILPNKIRKLGLNLCKEYQNNLGDVLQAWTYSTFVKDDDEVQFREEDYEFFDFLSQQELLILKQALLFRTITEFGLKRAIGSGYDALFKSSIKRLINTKVLQRDLQGKLYINNVVLSDINKILLQKSYITNA